MKGKINIFNKKAISVFMLTLFITTLSFSTSYAVTSSPPIRGVSGLILFFNYIFGLVFPLLISLAVIYFIWQVFRYTIADNEDTKGKAKDQIVWGIVGLFVMVSVWGLVSILSRTFNLNNTAINPPPLTY